MILKERIMNSIGIGNGGCWIWIKSRNIRGYGQLSGENLKKSPSISKGRKICRTCNLAWRKKNRRKNENE